jgi:mannose-6-phosphate isomerase
MAGNAKTSIYRQPWRLVPNQIRGRGGREIDRFRGVEPAEDFPAGSEAWIGSTTAVGRPPEDNPNWGRSEVELPDGRRTYLLDAILEAPEEVLGAKHIAKNGKGAGVLVKYLDAQFQYGLQCHPTREFAKKMWDSDYGKEESWYVLDTRTDTEKPAYILLGFKEGVTRADWEKHYRNDDLAALENLCHRIEVKKGEAYLVGGGVPHALGEGCFVIEVQEPADITVGARSYSFMKANGREPDVDETLFDERLIGAYIYDGCTPEENLRRWRIPRQVFRGGDWGSEAYVIGPSQTKYFSFSELTVKTEAEVLSTGFPRIGIVTAGSGKLVFDGGEMELKKGDEIFLPYNIPSPRALGDLTLILCHPEGANAD